MSLYDALNAAKSATLAEIKKAYRSLAKMHHPDAGGDPARFNEIALAYDECRCLRGSLGLGSMPVMIGAA